MAKQPEIVRMFPYPFQESISARAYLSAMLVAFSILMVYCEKLLMIFAATCTLSSIAVKDSIAKIQERATSASISALRVFLSPRFIALSFERFVMFDAISSTPMFERSTFITGDKTFNLRSTPSAVTTKTFRYPFFVLPTHVGVLNHNREFSINLSRLPSGL